MIVLALTGSIGMGKSTALQMFRDAGAEVWSADEAVHRLYAKGGTAVGPVAALFPEAVREGAVDRDALAALVLGDPSMLKALEAAVHPLVAADRAVFLEACEARNAKIAVLDIPLLFEIGAQDAFDRTVVVSAPAQVQRARVLARPGMTAAKFEAILGKQMPDAEKRRRADYVIETGGPIEATRAAVFALTKALLA